MLAALEHLFAKSQGKLCPEGAMLLRTFAERRPFGFPFLRPQDLIDLRTSAFTGIPVLVGKAVPR
jgi:hypothetical protein